MADKKLKSKFGTFRVVAPIPKKHKDAFDTGLLFAKELKITRIGKSITKGSSDLEFTFSDKTHANKFSKYMQQQGYRVMIDRQFTGSNTVTIKENIQVNEKFPENWQLDPKKIDTSKVQVWTRSGTMITAQMPKKDAQTLVKNKKAFIITGQAIGLFENKELKENIMKLYEAKSKEQVYMQDNTLWWSYSPGSGQTKPIRDFKSYFTDKSGDSHYDAIAVKIVKWANQNTPLKQSKSKTRKLFKIPVYESGRLIGYETSNLSIWGGNTKPIKYYYLVVIKEQNYHLIHIFIKSSEAMYWLKEINEKLKENKMNEAKMKRVEFGKLNVGDEFFFDPKDDEIWVKNSTKTAKIKRSGRKFQTSAGEVVYIKENKMNEISRGGMKIGKIYIQTFDNGDKLYFRPTSNTNNGVKGILYTDYAGRKLAGKNPKKYSVTDIDMNLWSDVSKVPPNIESKLKENKQQGENKMKIKLSELKQMIKEVIKEETEYQKFFKGALEKFGAKSPADLGDKKKEFFDYVDKNWHGSEEAPEEKGTAQEVLEPVSPASGNPLKSVKAKKAARILASEQKVEDYVRKIVKEELRFVMFDQVPGSVSYKVAKKRITQTGDGNKSL